VSDALHLDTLAPAVRMRLMSAVVRPVDLERAVEDVFTQLQSRASLGIAISKAPLIPPGYARAMQATENVWREIDEEFGLMTSAEVAVAIGSKSQNRYLASALRRKGKLLGIRRLTAYRYPGFQFQSDGTIHPAISKLVSSMREGGWSRAIRGTSINRAPPMLQLATTLGPNEQQGRHRRNAFRRVIRNFTEASDSLYGW